MGWDGGEEKEKELINCSQNQPLNINFIWKNRKLHVRVYGCLPSCKLATNFYILTINACWFNEFFLVKKIKNMYINIYRKRNANSLSNLLKIECRYRGNQITNFNFNTWTWNLSLSPCLPTLSQFLYNRV